MLKKIISITICLLLVITILFLNAKYLNPLQLKIRQEEIISSKIDKDLNGLTIIYLSDLFYGKFIDNNYFTKMIERINDYQADIILYGGDITNEELTIEQTTYLIEQLHKLEAKYGKYVVLGENDLSDSNKQIYLQSSFKILDNQHQTIYIDKDSAINIIGLNSNNLDPSSAFYGINNQYFNLVLTHYPDDFDVLENNSFDYMLAGHSLGGQDYIPVISLFNRPLGAKHYLRNKTYKNNKVLDITNGIGFLNSKTRLFSDSEIVIYKFKTDTNK